MAQEGDPRWLSRVKTAWPFSAWVGTVLFAVAGAAGLVIGLRMGIRNPLLLVPAVADPAAASLLMLGLTLAAPDIYIADRVRLVHVFVFPTLYLLGVLIFRFMIASSEVGLIVSAINTPRVDSIWSSLPLLSLVCGGQVLLLFIFFLAGRSAKPDKLS